jgi:hypothetical protein
MGVYVTWGTWGGEFQVLFCRSSGYSGEEADTPGVASWGTTSCAPAKRKANAQKTRASEDKREPKSRQIGRLGEAREAKLLREVYK